MRGLKRFSRIRDNADGDADAIHRSLQTTHLHCVLCIQQRFFYVVIVKRVFSMILVTGSTGNVGGKLLGELTARKVAFRAIARKPKDVEHLRAQGVDAVLGDITDRESIRTALQGVTHFYILTPSSPQLAEIEGKLVDEAKQAGIQHIVKHSVLGADVHATCPFTQVHAQAEEAIKASGIPYTFLRLNSFMQNFVTSHARSIIAQGTFYEALADAGVSHVDTRDIAVAAATVLTEAGHEGRAYDITGPEALTDTQIAEKLSAVLGKQVTYTPVPDEAMRQGLLSAGLSDWYADSLVKLNQFYRQGGGAPVTPDLEQLIGKKPRRMDAYLQENISAFRG